MTLLSVLRPTTIQAGTSLVDDTFDADTLGGTGSWTPEAGTSWSVVAAPTGLNGRAMQGTPDGFNDNYLRRTFTRQTGGEFRVRWKVKTPSTVGSNRAGVMQILDTTGSYVAAVGPIAGIWSYSNASGTSGSVGSWAADTVYDVEITVNLDAKTWKFAVGTTYYDNAGAGFPLTTGTTGVDRVKLSAYSPTTAAFWVDDVQVGVLVPINPPPTATGTLSQSGTFDGFTLGPDRLARVVLGYANSDPLVANLKVERSTNNSTWADISPQVSVTGTGTGRWVAVDRRPHYGAQSIAYGGTVYYRISGANSGGSTPPSTSTGIVVNIDQAAFEAARFPALSSVMAGTFVPSSLNGPDAQTGGDPYPIYWLAAMTYAYAKTSTAQYLTDVSNQFAYIQTLTQANGIVQLPDYADFFYRDHHWRTVLHVAACSRLLRRKGQTTLANSMVAQCDSWVSSWYANLNSGAPSVSVTRSGWDANNDSTANVQQVWAASTAYAVGAIVTPTTRNGRTYRVTTAGTTAATQPTWPTVAGGTVTNGTVTFTETTVTGNTSYATYSTVSPYTGTAGDNVIDLNQILEQAAALALLTTDTSSALNTAGANRTKALADITDLTALTTAYATSTGAVPIGDTYPALNGPEGYDTNYGAYVLTLASIAYTYAPTQTNQYLDEMVRKALTGWLNTSYATEPLGTMHYSGQTIVSFDEIVNREYPSKVFSITNPVANIRWTAAVNNPNERHGDYDATGAVVGYAAAVSARVFQNDVFVELLNPSAQTFTLTLTGTSAQTPGRVAQVNATRSAAGSQAAAVTRQPQPRRTATSANTTTVARSTSVVRAAASPNVAVVVKRPARSLTATSTQQAAVTAVKSKLVTLTAASPNVAVLVRVPGAIRVGGSPQIAAIVRQTQAQRAGASAQVGTVTTTRVVLKTLTGASAQSATVTRTSVLVRLATSPGLATVTRVFQGARTLTAVSPQVAAIVRQVRATRSAASPNVGTVTTTKVLLKTLTGTSAQVATAVRSVITAKLATSPNVATVTRVFQAARTLLATSPNVATVVRRVSLTKTATSAQVATLATTKVFLKTLTATSAQVAALIRQPRAIRQAASPQAASLTRTAALPRAAASPNVGGATKQARRSVSAANGSAATVTFSRVAQRTLTATSPQLASTRRDVTASRVGVSPQVPTLVRVLPPRTFTASSLNVATMTYVYSPVFIPPPPGFIDYGGGAGPTVDSAGDAIGVVDGRGSLTNVSDHLVGVVEGG